MQNFIIAGKYVIDELLQKFKIDIRKTKAFHQYNRWDIRMEAFLNIYKCYTKLYKW